MQKEITPNLFLIGFPKCATTTFYQVLQSHPEIFMTRVKKPDYFMFRTFDIGLNDPDISESERQVMIIKIKNVNVNQTDNLNSYLRLFSGSEEFMWKGEASHYSNFPRVPFVIKSEGISPKIIACIRDPVKRFISHYDMMVKGGHIDVPFISFFQKCLDLEVERSQWSYLQRSPLSSGLYSEYLGPYIEVFGYDNVLVLLFEDIQTNYYETNQKIYKWLNVNPDFKPKFVHRSVGGQFSNNFYRSINKLLGSKLLAPIRSLVPVSLKYSVAKLGRKKIEVSLKDAEKVREFYTSDIEELQHLIQRKLSY